MTHVRDSRWTTDLLWNYLHEKEQHHDSVYKDVLLNPRHTNPQTPSEFADSKIPWNQLNIDFLRRMAQLGYGRNVLLCCGTAVKIFLQAYIRTYPSTGEPWAHPFYRMPPPSSRRFQDIAFKENEVAKGVAYIKKLLAKGIAVRIPLLHTSRPFSLDSYNRSKIGAHHYVGIVGLGSEDTFLYVDPWPGFSGVFKYAGQDSKFLGVMKYDGHFMKCACPGTQASDCVAIAAPTWVPKNVVGP